MIKTEQQIIFIGYAIFPLLFYFDLLDYHILPIPFAAGTVQYPLEILHIYGLYIAAVVIAIAFVFLIVVPRSYSPSSEEEEKGRDYVDLAAEKVVDASGSSVLKCGNCNAPMHFGDRSISVCGYCGAENRLVNLDGLAG
jgi:hypothetical protein